MLNKTIEYNQSDVQELLTNGVALMEVADQVCTELKSVARDLKEAYDLAPAEAKHAPFAEAIDDAAGAINNAQSDLTFAKMAAELKGNLIQFSENIPMADAVLGRVAQEAISITKQSTAMLQSLIDAIPSGMGGDYKEFSAILAGIQADVREMGGDLLTNMENLSRALKGITECSEFSEDPVNLSTGNFIYDKADLSIKGRCPLSFRRFYNAINDRSGSLGHGWNHNHEIYIEEKDGHAAVILEDGREDIFTLAGKAFVPFFFSGSTLVKAEDGGYLYITLSQKKYHFDNEGRHTRQEDLNRNGISLIYEDVEGTNADGASIADKTSKAGIPKKSRSPFRLSKALEDTGLALSFSYHENGQLESVTDHTGRTIRFTYEDGLLHSVTNLLDGVTTYNYAHNGKLESVENAAGIKPVTNEYDYQDRTVKQAFPDGGEMKYEYLDREKQLDSVFLELLIILVSLSGHDFSPSFLMVSILSSCPKFYHAH